MKRTHLRVLPAAGMAPVLSYVLCRLSSAILDADGAHSKDGMDFPAVDGAI